MNYLTSPKEKAILYRVQAEWVLELIDANHHLSKVFTTAKQAKDFARLKRISLRRAENCDS